MNLLLLRKGAVLVLLLLILGCGKKVGSWAEAAPGEWQRVAGCGVSIDAVWLGKVKGQAMMGEGESRDKVLIFRTRFRNFDDATPVKYTPWQADGTMFSAPGVVLKDGKGVQYKPVYFGMFDRVEGRQKPNVELKASDEPLPDLLTFEEKAAEAAELFLELPARWFVGGGAKGWQAVAAQQTFRFRIPRSAWEGKKDPDEIYADVVPGKWERFGPVGATIDGVRVGKVTTAGFPGKGESRDAVFQIRTRFKNFDDKQTIKHLPWQTEIAVGFGGPTIILKDDKENRFNLVQFGLFASVEGRQKSEVELRASDPPVSDLLTFESKAGDAGVLFLELPAQYQQQGPQGWAPGPRGRFRFRIPRSMWTAAK